MRHTWFSTESPCVCGNASIGDADGLRAGVEAEQGGRPGHWWPVSVHGCVRVQTHMSTQTEVHTHTLALCHTHTHGRLPSLTEERWFSPGFTCRDCEDKDHLPHPHSFRFCRCGAGPRFCVLTSSQVMLLPRIEGPNWKLCWENRP